MNTHPLCILQDVHRVNTENLHKLVTKEDGHSFHIHKLLGIACLLHYVYRFYLVVVHQSMLFYADWTTVACIALHMALNATSFLFKISGVRIQSGPMIYPEARWHSLLFAYRSFLTMGLMWVAQRYEWVFPLYFRFGMVFLTMYYADVVTEYFPKQGTTMRSMPRPEYFTPFFTQNLNRFYTFSQIVATTQILFSCNMDGVFSVGFPIQMAAFLMTLVRKGIITAGGWHYIYSLTLITGVVSNFYIKTNHVEQWGQGFTLPCIVFVFVMRTCFSHVSKYTVWAIMGGVHLYSMIYLGLYREILV